VTSPTEPPPGGATAAARFERVIRPGLWIDDARPAHRPSGGLASHPAVDFRLLTSILVLLAGCPTADPEPPVIDADGDGIPQFLDCDDTDPGRALGVPELCNGVDDDCDGVVDDRCAQAGEATRWMPVLHRSEPIAIGPVDLSTFLASRRDPTPLESTRTTLAIPTTDEVDWSVSVRMRIDEFLPLDARGDGSAFGFVGLVFSDDDGGEGHWAPPGLFLFPDVPVRSRIRGALPIGSGPWPLVEGRNLDLFVQRRGGWVELWVDGLWAGRRRIPVVDEAAPGAPPVEPGALVALQLMCVQCRGTVAELTVARPVDPERQDSPVCSSLLQNGDFAARTAGFPDRWGPDLGSPAGRPLGPAAVDDLFAEFEGLTLAPGGVGIQQPFSMPRLPCPLCDGARCGADLELRIQVDADPGARIRAVIESPIQELPETVADGTGCTPTGATVELACTVEGDMEWEPGAGEHLVVLRGCPVTPTLYPPTYGLLRLSNVGTGSARLLAVGLGSPGDDTACNRGSPPPPPSEIDLPRATLAAGGEARFEIGEASLTLTLEGALELRIDGGPGDRDVLVALTAAEIGEPAWSVRLDLSSGAAEAVIPLDDLGLTAATGRTWRIEALIRSDGVRALGSWGDAPDSPGLGARVTFTDAVLPWAAALAPPGIESTDPELPGGPTTFTLIGVEPSADAWDEVASLGSLSLINPSTGAVPALSELAFSSGAGAPEAAQFQYHWFWRDDPLRQAMVGFVGALADAEDAGSPWAAAVLLDEPQVGSVPRCAQDIAGALGFDDVRPALLAALAARGCGPGLGACDAATSRRACEAAIPELLALLPDELRAATGSTTPLGLNLSGDGAVMWSEAIGDGWDTVSVTRNWIGDEVPRVRFRSGLRSLRAALPGAVLIAYNDIAACSSGVPAARAPTAAEHRGADLEALALGARASRRFVWPPGNRELLHPSDVFDDPPWAGARRRELPTDDPAATAAALTAESTFLVVANAADRTIAAAIDVRGLPSSWVGVGVDEGLSLNAVDGRLVVGLGPFEGVLLRAE
jgi:hypothetical protein